MQITAVGTVWKCEEDKEVEESELYRYTIELVEHLSGATTTDLING
jgi:hypothetical protein